MIKLFEHNAITFTTNGLRDITNILTYAESEDNLNGLYSAEFDFIYDTGGKWKDITEERIIFADGQPFRIYKIQKQLNGATAFCRHVLWDLLDNEVRDVRPTGATCMIAMQNIFTAAQYAHSFTAYSNISTTNTQYFINRNIVDCLLGTDSVRTRWDAELELDKFEVRLLSRRGADNGVLIAYRKNLKGLTVTEDRDGLITRIRPQGKNGLELPEVYVDSPNVGAYAHPIIREIKFNDIGVDENTTEAQAIILLRAAANAYFTETQCDVPLTNIEADMILLENTAEYAGFESLVRVKLGDTVVCRHLDLGVNFTARIIKVKKDLLTGKNATVEIGSVKKSFATTFNTLNNTIKDISEVIVANKTELETAIDDATILLNTALGGHVLKRENELLIMDTADPSTATKIWKWNINGLGYSGTGIAGPFPIAITNDGKIVATFITTGGMSAARITTGILQDAVGKNWINMDTGAFSLANGNLTYDGTTFASSTLQKTIYQGASAPGTPYSGQLWLDTGTTPHVLKRYSGSVWAKATPTTASEVGAYTQAETASLITQSVTDWTAQFASLSFGKMMYVDPTFRKGNNGINVYNNTGDGSVVHTRITKPTDAPTLSGYALRIVTTGATSTPGAGGFTFSTQTRANMVLITKIIAKIPVGKTLTWAANAMGDGVTVTWLTPTGGTGKYETYICKVVCGATGTFEDGEYFYLNPVGAVTWDVAYATVYDATESEDVFDVGIVQMNRYGITVSESTSAKTSTLSADGVYIADNGVVRAVFGDSSVIPFLEAEDFDCPVISGVINNGASYSIGSGYSYSSVGYVLQNVLKNRRVLNGAVLHFDIYGTINENIYISGFIGTGILQFNLYNSAKINGGFTIIDNTVRVNVYNAGTGRPTIKRTNTEPIVIKNSSYVALTSLNIDCANAGGAGVYGAQGSFVKMNDVDIANGAQWAVIAIDGAEFRCFSNRGNASSAGYAAQYGGIIYSWGTSPNANKYEDLGSVIGTLNPTASTFSVPPVTQVTYTQVFSHTQMVTWIHGTTTVDSYYGASAAQNRWDSSMGWKDGVAKFGAEVYNFFNGGSAITIRMRLRRKNSTHGSSSGVVPAPYNYSASGYNAVLRGDWSAWATLSNPTSLFGSGGGTLKHYSGVSGSAGYSIWDAAQVEVTVTKTI